MGSEEVYRRCKGGGGRLLVPTLELVEVLAARLGHRLSEVVTRDGLPIVAVEVQLHALAEVGVANQRAHHPDDLRALVARSESVSE